MAEQRWGLEAQKPLNKRGCTKEESMRNIKQCKANSFLFEDKGQKYITCASWPIKEIVIDEQPADEAQTHEHGDLSKFKATKELESPSRSKNAEEKDLDLVFFYYK